ncbi:hypothetical protein OG785_45590 [Streptomyces sp. NBC_00006]|uniref:hypothetical protein n=1 Tax=Streptomyces sp. NBC_00006 TaxID=2975619 RepID=UPI00224EDEBA|nr:hypothetical protein [Streptomyces sp. NBC_00006]MCX5537834.1 hypothetical protein [Streptomyces sp. NBC_00006]
MDLTREPVAIARSAAEEIRALNHRTINRGAFEEPSEIYSTVGGLAQTVQGVPQAIQQIWGHLRAMRDDDVIRMDNDTDVATAAEEARQELDEARKLLAQAGRKLDRASSVLAHMGGQW